MPRSIEGIVAAHQAAVQRRAAGRPIWDRHIRLGDVFHNDALTFPQRRDAIVARLRASGWAEDNDNIAELVDDIAQTHGPAGFDPLWDEVYDEADLDRVWIDIHGR